ncbi:hypothetical protein C8R44DRAFT_895043 [Mycena epipterygia]|nr:hypothetical protein C8R44DRAFT_895043 [Mycena epipterygia]
MQPNTAWQASDTDTSHARPIWTQADETALLLYLLDARAWSSGDGGRFSPRTFRDAADVLERHRTKGGTKNPQACMNRYRALRQIFNVIAAIKAAGWSWNDTQGVNVSPATQGAWDTFVAVHPAAAEFRNIGWPFFDLMAPLIL